MPCPVEELAQNKTSEKSVDSEGQASPTDLKSAVDKNENEIMENVQNSSKLGSEQSNQSEEKHKFIMTETTCNDEQDFIVTFSCTKCACIAHSDYSEDKELRKKKKSSRRCFCVTLFIAVIFCLSVIATLSYLTFTLLNDKSMNNNHGYSQKSNTLETALMPKYDSLKTVSSVGKFSLDVNGFNPSRDKVLPWNRRRGSDSMDIFRYHESNHSISVLESGKYIIQVTLSADTNSLSAGEFVTILPCVSYKDKEQCQRIKIPAGMTVPIHLHDIVSLEAYDTVKVTVLCKINCIYTSPRHNTMNIVRLN